MPRVETHVTRDGAVRQVIYEPGNATRYEMLACRHPAGRRSWMVMGGDSWGGAMRVLEGACLDVEDVAEGMARRDTNREYNAIDASEFAKCIAMLVPRVTADVRTDETGHLHAGATSTRWEPSGEYLIDWDAHPDRSA